MFLKKIDHGESESVIGFRFGLIVYELEVPKMDPYVDKEQYETGSTSSGRAFQVSPRSTIKIIMRRYRLLLRTCLTRL